MKRTVSMILAILLTVTCFLSLPVLADGTTDSVTPVKFDYAKKYRDLNLSEATDAAGLEGLGVKLFAVGSGEEDLSYAKLTEKGLELTSVNKKARGFVVNGADLAGKSSYLVQLTMSFDQLATNCYPFFGFGFKENASDWNVFSNNANRNNFRFNGGSALVVNGFTSSDNMAVLWTALYTEHKEATYQFVVDGGKLTRILIQCDGTLYTFAAKSDCNMSAATGDFLMSFRTDGDSTTKITLRDLAILNADQQLKPDGDTPSEGLENILTANRKQPAEPELAYTDAADTRYRAGYVLHYMDFSKVTDFSKTGYFVTNDAEPEGFMIKDGELRIKTNASDGVKVMLTGNGIPKNIQNFTVQIRFRFVEPSSSYFVFIQSNTIGEDGKTSGEKNTCFRYNGTLDNCTTTAEESVQNAFWDAVRAGEEVVFSYAAMERETYRIIATCGGQTVTWYKASNTISTSDSFFGFMVGRGTNLAISSVAVIAETPDDYAENGLIWPGEANALVQNVSADALKKEEPTEPPTSEKPTEETPTKPVEKPTGEPSANERTEEKSEESTTGAADDGKRGCQSSVKGCWVIAAILLSAAVIAAPMKKRRRG